MLEKTLNYIEIICKIIGYIASCWFVVKLSLLYIDPKFGYICSLGACMPICVILGTIYRLFNKGYES